MNLWVTCGFSVNDTSWAILVKVRVWKVHAYSLLMKIAIIGIYYSLLLLCCMPACFTGSYMACMLCMVSSMLLSVENFQSRIYKHRFPLYV